MRHVATSAAAPLLLLALACSSGKDFAGKTGGFEPNTILSLAGFTGSVVREERRFVGYARKAGRISVIDPEAEREVWGITAGGGIGTVLPLPAFDGVALLEDDSLRVLSAAGERRFDLVGPFAAAAFARLAPAYAFFAEGAASFRILRHLGGAAWQDGTLEAPWNDAAPAPGEDDPPAVAALFSADGLRLVVVRPYDGAYLVYTAASREAPLAGPARACPGSAPADGKPVYRTAALDEDTGRLLLGDRAGRVLALPLDACADWAAAPALQLPQAFPVTDVNTLGGGDLTVTQAGPFLHVTRFDGTAFAPPRTLADGLCPYPLGALRAAPDLFAVTCFDPLGFDPVRDRATAPATVRYERVYVQAVDLATGAAALRLDLDLDAAAGISLDAAGGKALVLKDNALGLLEVTALATGERRVRRGIFLDAILD